MRDGDATVVGVRTRRACAPRRGDAAFAVLDEIDARRLLGRRSAPTTSAARSNACARAPPTTSGSPTSRSRATTRGSSSRRRREPELVGDGARRACWRRPRARATRRCPAATGCTRRGRRASTGSTHAARVRGRARAARRGRVLPGEPHPPAHVRPTRPIPSRSTRALARAQPGAARRAAARSAAARPGARGRVGVARAVPATSTGATVETRPIKGTAADRARARGERQGPRRERDDRRPRAQRPRARVRVRDRSRCPTLCAVEAHPGLHHLVSTVHGRLRADVGLGDARARRRSRPRRSPARRSRACCRRSKTSSRCAAASTAARSAGSTPTRDAPSSRSRSARSRSPAARPYLGVGGGIVADSRRRRRVGRDRAEGGAPARASPARDADARSRRDRRADDRSGSTASSSPLDEARDLAARPRPRSSATACSRRSASTAACRSRGRRHLDAAARARPTGLGLDGARPRRAARRGRRGARGERAHARRACASRSPAASRRPARSAATAPPTVVRRRRSPIEPCRADRSTSSSCRGRATSAARLAGLKTISYAENVRALAYAQRARRGRGDLRQHPRRPLRGDRLERVPRARRRAASRRPPTAGCLLGVTRALVLELARASSASPIEERDVAGRRARATPTRRSSSSTTREVQPIARVDGVALPAAPGPITARLAAAFTDLVARDLDP